MMTAVNSRFLRLLTLVSMVAPALSFTTSVPFAQSPNVPHLRPASCSPAQFSRTSFLTVSRKGNRASSRLPLHMSSLGNADFSQEDKIREAKRLADEAAKALELASEAGAKAAALRGSSDKVYAADRSTDIRTQELLGSIGGALYKSWAAVLTGAPWKAGDLLGLRDERTEQEQLEMAREVFQRFDTDGSGGIDNAELLFALQEVVGLDADQEQVSKMLSEADENGDGVIQFGEFMKIQAEIMREQDLQKAAAAAAARLDAQRPVAKETVEKALAEQVLVGDALAATAALDSLKQEGVLRKWGSFSAVFRPIDTERMLAVTGMQDAQEDLGLGVDALTRLRYQGVGLLSWTGGFALIFAGLFPESLRPSLISFGYYTLALNTLSAILSGPIDRSLQKFQLQRTDRDGERWTYRQAGRLVAAYLCGLPLRSLEAGDAGYMTAEPYSRRSGEVDFAALRKDVSPEGLFSSGLSDRELQQQAIVQMVGPVAEYKKFGKASFGGQFFAELERQMALSERALRMDPLERQSIAQFGVATAFTLVDTYADAVERVAKGLKQGSSLAQLIAEIEAADVAQ